VVIALHFPSHSRAGSIQAKNSQPDDPPVQAPVAIRLATREGFVWLVAAGPRDSGPATEDLTADGVYLGHDELIVVFDDERAQRIGVVPTR